MSESPDVTPKEGTHTLSNGCVLTLRQFSMLDDRELRRLAGKSLLDVVYELRQKAPGEGQEAEVRVEDLDVTVFAILLWLASRRGHALELDAFLEEITPGDVIGALGALVPFLLRSLKSGTQAASS